MFSLAVGGPVLAWIVFAGLDGGADAGDLGDMSGGHGSHGDGVLSFLSVSSIAFVLTFFGLTGLVSHALGASTVLAFVLAVVLGFGTGFTNAAAFRWIRRNSTSSDVSDRELEGSIARVLLPVESGHRGRIAVNIAGAREQMTADTADGTTMSIGAKVVIVEVVNGVALVASLDTALGTGHDVDQID